MTVGSCSVTRRVLMKERQEDQRRNDVDIELEIGVMHFEEDKEP